MDYQPCPIWTITRGIRSYLDNPFLFWWLLHFRRRIRSGERIFSLFPSELAWFFPFDILGGLLSCLWVWYYLGPQLYSCHPVFDCPTACLAVLLPGSWSSQSFPWFSGLSEFLGSNDSQLRVTSREVLFLPYVVLFLRQRIFRQDSSLLSDGIFSVSVFSHVMWKGEGEIEVIEEFGNSVLWGFYYQLTLSRIEFSECRTRYLLLF